MYEVYWAWAVERDLREIRDAGDALTRHEILVAVQTLGEQLRRDAASVGESRAGINRITFVHPFGFTFRVHLPQRVATVLSAWQYCG